MKRYTRSDIELKFPFKETTTEYYLADDVADLARRVLITLKHARIFITTREKMHEAGVHLYDKDIAELEGIAKK